MSAEAIIVTIVSSLISGLLGVAVSTWYFYKLERHKQKLDLARRLLGNRFNISGEAFSCALNEVLAVFADSQEVLEKLEKLYESTQVPGKPNTEASVIDLLKAVCKDSGLTQTTLNEDYFIKTFNVRP